mmetsp:Transcript_87818/g.246693  ORF Transcript_87818/g.246693 Transcript_87818/m.246693 type:complete len:91 (-) Transcript_87818:107-379(-)
MLPLGRTKGTTRAAQGSGAASSRRREGPVGAAARNSQDAAMASEDATMGVGEDFLEEEVGPENEYESLLEGNVHADYDKKFGDDFDDGDV